MINFLIGVIVGVLGAYITFRFTETSGRANLESELAMAEKENSLLKEANEKMFDEGRKATLLAVVKRGRKIGLTDFNKVFEEIEKEVANV